MNTIRILAAALALSASVAQANAGQETSTTNCRFNVYTGYTCSTVSRDDPEPRPLSPAEIAELEQDARDRDARIAKWESFCKPVIKADSFGVPRYSYAHKNCDFGRTE